MASPEETVQLQEPTADGQEAALVTESTGNNAASATNDTNQAEVQETAVPAEAEKHAHFDTTKVEEAPDYEELEYGDTVMDLKEVDGAIQQRRKSHHNRRRSTIISTTSSAPFDVSYHPGAFKLFAPPKQRQKWGDTQILPRLNWGDLYFDLFYVAMAYNISNILVEAPTAEGFLYFVGTLFPVMHIWMEKMFFDARFSIGDDIYHRIFEVAALVILALAIVHIRSAEVMSNPSDNIDMFVFCLSITVSLILVLTRYVEVYKFGIGQTAMKEFVGRDAMRYLGALISVYLAATIVAGVAYFGEDEDDKKTSAGDKYESNYDEQKYSDGYRNLAGASDYASDSYNKTEPNHIPILIGLCGFVLLLIYRIIFVFYFFPNDGSHKNFTIPINVDFCIHRNSEWVMLMLGESILSILIVDIENEDSRYYSTFYASLLTVVLLQYLHFRSQPHYADAHALRRHKDAGIMWSFSQYFYSGALIALGAAFTNFLLEFGYSEDDYGSDDGYGAGDDGHRMLAGGGSSAFSTEERQQRAADLFTASFTITLVCLDYMSYLHVGSKDSKERLFDFHDKTNVLGILLIVLRAAVLIFTATLSRWETNPKILSSISVAITVLQILFRWAGCVIYPDTDDEEDDHGHH